MMQKHPVSVRGDVYTEKQMNGRKPSSIKPCSESLFIDYSVNVYSYGNAKGSVD